MEIKKEDLDKADIILKKAKEDLINILGVDVELVFVVKGKTKEEINVELLFKITAATCNLSVYDILSRHRDVKTMLYARYIIAKIMFDVLHLPSISVGKLMNRTHSTAMHNAGMLANLYHQDSNLKEYYNKVLSKFMSVKQ